MNTPAERSVRVGLLQHACGADRDENLRTAAEMAHQAADDGAQLLVTQELFGFRYFPQAQDETRFDLAETIPGPTTEALGALARDRGVSICASLFERRAAGVYHNTSVMIDPRGDVVGRYRKMHIPDDPRFYEKFYFTPGDLGFDSQQLPQCRAGMLICWDQWFPEAARLTAMAGAELLLFPTAIASWHAAPESNGDGARGDTPEERERQLDAWRTIQRSHAIANGVFVITVNRIGIEDELRFWGSSFVADPTGTVIAEAPRDEAAVLVVDCDLGTIERTRRDWPFLRDRRTDSYGDLARRMVD